MPFLPKPSQIAQATTAAELISYLFQAPGGWSFWTPSPSRWLWEAPAGWRAWADHSLSWWPRGHLCAAVPGAEPSARPRGLSQPVRRRWGTAGNPLGSQSLPEKPPPEKTPCGPATTKEQSQVHLGRPEKGPICSNIKFLIASFPCDTLGLPKTFHVRNRINNSSSSTSIQFYSC